MIIFIATNFDNRKLIQDLGTLLHGHEVYNWIRHECIRPYEEHTKLTRQYAVENADAIVHSDIFILLNNQECRNTYTELGIAIHSCIVSNKPKIYVVGEINSSVSFRS